MSRYKASIEYDGTGLVGWQKQPNELSVQQYIETAIYKFSKQSVDLVAAGRTDAGVHAFCQTAHFDLDTKLNEARIAKAINAHLMLLKANVAIVNIEKVDETFHARFDATKRSYVYKIVNRPAHSPLQRNFAWHVYVPLNIEKMIEASKYLIGTHDFSSFRDTQCQAKSPIRTIEKIEIKKTGNEIEFYFEARSFLHHQVRNMVGTLKMIGEGIFLPKDIKTILEAKDRTKAGVNAPAFGLYMKNVLY